MQVMEDKEALVISLYVNFKLFVVELEKAMFAKWAKLGYSRDQIETILRKYEEGREK